MISNARFAHLYVEALSGRTHGAFQIGDFGLSRDLDENPYYITHKGTIPLKWSAPEVRQSPCGLHLTILYHKPSQAFMYGKFSTSSDVYSYGMLLYEIWSCGCKPMVNVGMEEVCLSMFHLHTLQIVFLFVHRPRDYWQKGTANPHLQGVPGEYMRSWYDAGK